MDVPYVLTSMFEPYRERITTATYGGLDKCDRLVALSVAEIPDRLPAMSLANASNRSLTSLRRDSVIDGLRAVFDGSEIEFRFEHSWVNARIPSKLANVRLRVKRFDGEDGEQTLAASQLTLLDSDDVDLDVTLGWLPSVDTGWSAYLAYVSRIGVCEWKMALLRTTPAKARDTWPRASSGAGARGGRATRRVRRIVEQRKSNEDGQS